MIGALGVAIGIALAKLDVRSMFDYFNMLLGLLGSGLAGVFALGVFTKRASAAGAALGALAGVSVTLWVKLETDVIFFLYAPIGIAVCVVVGLVVSALFPPRDTELRGLTLWTMPERAAG